MTASGEALGEALADADGEGDGLGATPPYTGGGNARTGSPFSAAVMKRFHVRAGKVPPVTSPTPAKLRSGRSGRSENSATAVASCGVYPTNQAAVLRDVVPVLPAAGRPGNCAARPVPAVTTC